jgi:DNA-3-methyladenine glycosylase
MQRRRPATRKPKDLASGPGKLTLALAITHGALVVSSPAESRAFHIETTPRIGITKCADWPLRFVIRPEH